MCVCVFHSIYMNNFASSVYFLSTYGVCDGKENIVINSTNNEKYVGIFVCL